MRIVYLHQYFNSPSRPGPSRSYEMARRLVRYGHEVHMVTTSRDLDGAVGGWFDTEEDGIHVHWLRVPYSNSMSYARRIRAFATFAVRSARKAASLGGDIVLATSTPLTIALPAAYAARRLKAPMVFEIRDLWPELPIAIGALRGPLPIAAARWLERFAYRNAAEVIALSPGMRDGVVATGYPPDHVHVIPNSADFDKFSPTADAVSAFRSRFPWLGERPLVLYAGTIGRINGVDYLAEVAAKALAIDDTIRFVVIGEGGDERRVRERAAALGVLERNFFILPPMPKREIGAAFAAADIALSLFVDLPAMWANSANKFFDGLASGTPVAINYLGWQAEYLEQRDAGLVLPATDHQAASRMLVERLHDSAWLVGAGARAQQLARDTFDRETLARQFEAVLRRAVRQ